MIDVVLSVGLAGLITAILLGLGPEKIRALLWFLGTVGGMMALTAIVTSMINMQLAQ